VAADGEDQPRHNVTSDRGIETLLDGLVGDARRDRAELITWLLDRGFTVDQVAASLTPMMLPANRVMGDHGVYVSPREMSRLSGIELGSLQQLMRAAGLPRIEDPDAAVVPLVDGQAVAQAKYLLDIGLEPTEAVAALKVLTEGFGRFAAMMREPAFRLLVKPGASEIDIAAAAEALAQAAIPHAGPMLENLLRVQYRRMFEAEAIGVAERATGSLPGARQLSVAFADLVGFTHLGEMLVPEELEGLARRRDAGIAGHDAPGRGGAGTHRCCCCAGPAAVARGDCGRTGGQPCRRLVRQPGEHREPGHRPCAAGNRAGHRFCAAIQRYAGKSSLGAGRCSPPPGRARAGGAFPGSSGLALREPVRPLHARLSGHHLPGQQTTIDDVLSPGDESRVV